MRVIGDSFASGTFATALAARLGEAVVNDGVGGSGYIAGTNFNSRLAAAIAAAHSRVFVIGGQNDNSRSDADFAAAVSAFWTGLRAGLPSAALYGSLGYRHNGATKMAALQAAIAAAGGIYIDWLPWVTGTGYVGAENGTGNRDVYVGPDNVHPSVPAGATYFATRTAWAISPPSAGLRGL